MGKPDLVKRRGLPALARTRRDNTRVRRPEAPRPAHKSLAPAREAPRRPHGTRSPPGPGGGGPACPRRTATPRGTRPTSCSSLSESPLTPGAWGPAGTWATLDLTGSRWLPTTLFHLCLRTSRRILQWPAPARLAGRLGGAGAPPECPKAKTRMIRRRGGGLPGLAPKEGASRSSAPSPAGTGAGGAPTHRPCYTGGRTPCPHRLCDVLAPCAIPRGSRAAWPRTRS